MNALTDAHCRAREKRDGKYLRQSRRLSLSMDYAAWPFAVGAIGMFRKNELTHSDLTAPVAVHARHDHGSAGAVFLLVVGIADALGIRAGIV